MIGEFTLTIKELFDWANGCGIADDELFIKSDSGIFHVTTDNLSPSFRHDNTVINVSSDGAKPSLPPIEAEKNE